MAAACCTDNSELDATVARFFVKFGEIVISEIAFVAISERRVGQFVFAMFRLGLFDEFQA